MSGNCEDGGARDDKGLNFDCSVIDACETPPELDRYGRAGGWFFANDFSGVWDRRKNGYSREVGLAGGDMALGFAEGGALVYGEGEEDTGGREKGPTSRAGRSASEPSMADIDMLLPGR